MYKVSILMSTYNESIDELNESINSMLNQTFENFEFIIVNDNPKRKSSKRLLENYREKDKRIKIINNEKNIGLAMSLNKAAELAETEILVRMDADDISSPHRIEKQLNEIQKGYDFIFSPYILINEKSQPICLDRDWSLKYYSPYEIHKELPIQNIIHHPTVMMTKDIFNRAGGYRDFPCAQDYDLWLRIYDVGSKFKMVDEALLKYRIRENSISKTKQFQQKKTLDYINKLFIERVKTGSDSYSKDRYNNFFKKYEGSLQQKVEEIQYYNQLLIKAKESKRNHDISKYLYYRIKVFIESAEFRESYIERIKRKLLLYKYIKRNLKSLN